jgi:hypothetical protein
VLPGRRKRPAELVEAFARVDAGWYSPLLGQLRLFWLVVVAADALLIVRRRAGT